MRVRTLQELPIQPRTSQNKFSLRNPSGKLILTRSQLYQQLLRRANSHFARNLMLYLFVHSKSFPKNPEKRRSKKSLLSLLGKGRRPQRSRGPGARARARALSTPAFQGRTSESRLFCYVNLRSVSGKVVQFLEFGKCAKSKIDSF